MRLRHELFLVLAMVIWSGSWTSGKLIANSVDPKITLFWRFVFSAVSLAPLIYLNGERFAISLSQAGWAALGGLVITVYTFLFFIGLKTGFAGAAGVLVTSMNPIFTYFLTQVLLKHRLPRRMDAQGSAAGTMPFVPTTRRIDARRTTTGRDAVGLALGLSGGAVLLDVWNLSQDKMLLSGNLLFLVAAFIYALVTLTTNAATRNASIIVYSFYVNVFGAIFVIPFIGRGIDATPLWTDHTYWLNIFYLGVVSNAFATTVYFFAVKKLGSARASSYIFIVPATALLIAALYLNEPVKMTTLVGGMIALVAVTILRGKNPDP